MLRSLLIGLGAAAALTASATASQTVPSTFNYQGMLHFQGQPANGEYEFRFSLWDDGDVGEGNLIDNMAPEDLDVVNGLFSHDIKIDSADLDDHRRYLQIEVRDPNIPGSEFATLEPRQQLVSSPYSLATRGIYVAGNGRVGIGTQNPGYKLDVRGTIRGDSLRLVGGADIAEPFEIKTAEGIDVKPGMVVAIDPTTPGELRVSDAAYDACAAGIISGANGVNTGMMLSQPGTIADGTHPVALTGRVWCWVDADANGAIKPGDMLTTSTTAGHAMKSTDRERAFGATIGKAMTPLESGKGLVLVLVNLQ